MGNAPPPSPSPPTNLMRGWPNPSLLPASLLKSAATEALSDPSIFIPGLEYGPDPGYEPCRTAIADWLTTFYRPQAGAVGNERICITGGASQNLGCLLSVYSDPEYTRNIWIIAPAYFLAFRIFSDAGFARKMRAVPENDEGVDLAYLRREMERSEQEGRTKKGGVDRPKYKPERKGAKVYKHLIYCVPTFANPSSRTMSLRRRRELVRLAREYDALIVPDDVYDFLQWPAKKTEELENRGYLESTRTAHLPRLVDIDRELENSAEDGFGNTCSNGSFSKIVGPGVRVGWCEGSEKFAHGLSRCGTTASGGAPSQLTSTYLTTLLHSGGLDTHIAHTLRPAYQRRYSTMMSAIAYHLIPLGFRTPQPDREVVGGYFIWLALPQGLKADGLAERCRVGDAGVVIAPGTLFEVPGAEGAAGFGGYVRLCFAWEEEGKLGEGVERIAGVARAMLEELPAATLREQRSGDGGGGSEGFK